MEKIKMDYKNPKNVVVDFRDYSVEIKTFISIPEQILLINDYLNTYFNFNGDVNKTLIPLAKYNYFEAEYNLLLGIFNLNTNIDTDNIDFDIFESSNLKTLVFSNISNYDSFREMLYAIVSRMEKQYEINDTGFGFLRELSEKVVNLFSQVSSLQADDLNNLQEKTLSILELLEKKE